MSDNVMADYWETCARNVVSLIDSDYEIAQAVYADIPRDSVIRDCYQHCHVDSLRDLSKTAHILVGDRNV